MHTAFALHYAHEYLPRQASPAACSFRAATQHEDADYWDFVYFSFVIGMTAQVSDVGITDKIIRRTATAARHHLVRVQHRAAGADGEYCGKCDLSGRPCVAQSRHKKTKTTPCKGAG